MWLSLNKALYCGIAVRDKVDQSVMHKWKTVTTQQLRRVILTIQQALQEIIEVKKQI